LAPGVPAVEIDHRHERYSLLLRVSPGSRRDVLAIECRLDGDEKLRLYALLAPHLGATGYGNTAVVASHHGRLTLGAEQGPFGAALAAVDERQRDAIGRASAGYVGFSDGWQDFARNGRMSWEYRRDGPGNVALVAELPRRAVLSLGFGSSAEAAATLAIGSLLQPFDNLLQQHVALWQEWQAERSERYAVSLDVPPALADEFLVSTIVAAISTRPFRGRWWRASAFRGATAATSAAAIIWYGRAIWSRPPGRCWPSAPTRRRATHCAI
jgi:glucoamylase